MTGIRPGLYWQLTWRYIGPVIMVAILISSVTSMVIKHPTYAAWDLHIGKAVQTPYPNWVLGIAIGMVLASILPIVLVYLLRRFQVLSVDLDIHQGSIRRNETTASTKEMIDEDDVSREFIFIFFKWICLIHKLGKKIHKKYILHMYQINGENFQLIQHFLVGFSAFL
jgi:type IV secretory pathway TrbF-like protein